MKRRIVIAIISVAELLALHRAPAQGTLYLSNLQQTPTGNAAGASDSWYAALFRTGINPGGYTLNSVQLLMDSLSGSPSGFNVSLYNLNGATSYPGNSLGSLTGSEPSAGGIFTYTASSLGLGPSTVYFIVVTAATPVAAGYYNWSIGNSPGSYISSDGWFLGAGYNRSSDGSSWAYTRPLPLQFAVYARAVPEPSTLALAGLGLAALSFWRFRPSK